MLLFYGEACMSEQHVYKWVYKLKYFIRRVYEMLMKIFSSAFLCHRLCNIEW